MTDSDRRIPTEHPTPIIVQAPGLVSVASETIGALKASPLLLVVILLNAAFVGVGAFYLNNQQKGLEREVANILNRCLPDVHGDAYILPPGATAHVPGAEGLTPLGEPPDSKFTLPPPRGDPPK